jgi:signal-transduction protein with cAMP-binding, CBS, and nucleotidyltransferase domain
VEAQTLSRFQRFANLPQPKLRSLASTMSVWRFERQERIYVRSEPSRNFYVLLRGVAKLSGMNKMNELVLMALLALGDWKAIAGRLDVIVGFGTAQGVAHPESIKASF